VADNQPDAFRASLQQCPRISEHLQMGAKAGSVQINSLRSYLLISESPFNRLYITFDTAAKPSRRRQ
jgi:hypothetical protein